LLEARYNLKANKSKHLPKLTGTISYSDQGDNRQYSYTSPDDFYQDTFRASLTLNVPIYSGGGISSSARQAKAQYEQRKYISRYVERKVTQELHSNFSILNSNVAEFEARKTSVKANQNSLSYAQNSYRNGVSTYNDVVIAHRLLLAEKRSYIDIVYDYLLTGLKLKENIGSLSSKDINDLNQLFDSNKRLIKL
jgi:outer membrane protein